VGILNRIVGVWVHHGNNISQNIDFNILLENIKMYDRLYKYALNYNLNPIILKMWKILAKYKAFYTYVVRSENKDEIYRILNSDYKIYGYLLNLDPRLKKVF